MKKILKTIKKSTALFMLLAFAVSSLGISNNGLTNIANATELPNWDVTGSYVINENYLGADYHHDMSLVQDDSGNLTGNGGSPAGSNTYTWVLTSGSVSANTIDFLANYTATEDAVTPQTTMHVVGTIADDGTISGTWSDNYAGGSREGTLSTVSGNATAIPTPSTTVTVTIDKYIDGEKATAISGNNSDFQMNAVWDAENIGAGSGQYTLNEDNSYKAETVEMTSGADYSTNEVMDSVVSASCPSDAPFALVGYTTGNTLEEAASATPSLVAPSFVNITSDKFVIVWNTDCSNDDQSGEIGGEVIGGATNGVLTVTSIEMVDGTAMADGSFENGWEYVFNITVPTNENDLSVKFADWVINGGGSTIAAGNNIRISSPQANNGGATVLITAANLYSSPVLSMVTDLNPALDGIQVKVTVEVKIPVGSVNGAYTTNYGVKTE